LYLTREQEKMLEGEQGPALRKAIELLVAIGDVFGAECLVKVDSAHISGVSFRNLGEAGTEWLEEQAMLGAKTHSEIRATLNPAGMDMIDWQKMGVSKKFADGQRRVIKAFETMGVEPTCTCTPYLIGHTPRFGSQVAWAESNAVCFSNSVLGARTNRESGPTSLASAVSGLAPLYGYRLDENRLPKKVITVNAKLRTPMDFSAIGYLVGELLGNTVPYFKGLGVLDVESMKTLGAACATSGSIALWHAEDVTPEAFEVSKQLDGLETITIDEEDLKEVKEKFIAEPEEATYCLGCPHCSLKEIREIAAFVQGGDLEGKLWVFTSRNMYEAAKHAGLVDIIEKANGRIFRDTCMVVAPLKEMGWRSVVTNSFKGAHYSLAHGFPTKTLPVHELIEEALS
jgi:predicted aconitase